MSMTMVSMILASLIVARPTMTSRDEVVLSRVEAGIARTVEFGAIAVVVAGLSRTMLWHPGVGDTLGSSSNRDIAALVLVNMVHFRSHRDGSSELTCHGR
jgi:hypothetical protein